MNFEEWSEKKIVAKHLETAKTYAQIDFADLEHSDNPNDKLILNLNMKNCNIHHTFPKLDRCCKFHGLRPKYDGIDNMERIGCDIPKKDFIENYVLKREPIILTGCQDHWKAKNWTFENLLTRYNSPWFTTYYLDETQDWLANYLHGLKILEYLNNDYYVKVFHRLPKYMRGWLNDKTFEKVDLLDDYAFPAPFPDDLFEAYHADSDQAYVMLATAETGNILSKR